jgi:hypothetical protein
LDRHLNQTLARSLKRFAYNLIRATGELPPHRAGYRHAPVLPVRATYSLWLTDPIFQQAFDNTRQNTLVDCFRCYELWSLVEQSLKAGEGALIEVGGWRGGTTAHTAAKASRK